MIKYEDECVDCPQGCINCGRKHVPHYFCDDCGEEYQPEELYTHPDTEDVYCKNCILSKLETLADKF